MGDKKVIAILCFLIMLCGGVYLIINLTKSNGESTEININKSKDIPYSDSTVSESGGLLICLKGAVDRILNENRNIKEYVDFSVNNGYKSDTYGTSFRIIEAYATTRELNVTKIRRTDKEGLIKALKNNHPVIMLCGNGNFTDTGKYILLDSIDSEGNIRVYDPSSSDVSNGKYTVYYIINNSSIVMEDKTAYWEISAK